jgi:hypothetical protein
MFYAGQQANFFIKFTIMKEREKAICQPAKQPVELFRSKLRKGEGENYGEKERGFSRATAEEATKENEGKM